jgi:hypothetical protein
MNDSSPLWSSPDYPIGSKYRVKGTDKIQEVLEHGFCSVKLSRLGWVGTNEMTTWLKNGEMVREESDRD